MEPDGLQTFIDDVGLVVAAPTTLMGPEVTPQIAGDAVVELVEADPATVAPAYVLTGAGCRS